MLITLRNDFHNTETSLRITRNRISLAEAYMAWRTLCGVEGCHCGNTLGMRGPNPVEVDPIFGADGLCGYHLRTVTKYMPTVRENHDVDQWTDTASLPRAA